MCEITRYPVITASRFEKLKIAVKLSGGEVNSWEVEDLGVYGASLELPTASVTLQYYVVDDLIKIDVATLQTKNEHLNDLEMDFEPTWSQIEQAFNFK